MIYRQMLKESQKLEKQIKSLQVQLKSFPDGKLICSHNGNYNKWYQSDGKTKIYIPKEQRSLAEKLALKKYLSLQLQNMITEKNAIDFYLRHHNPNAFQQEISLLNEPGHKELLTPFFEFTSPQISEWINSSYEKNDKHPENLIYQALSGNLVRSKSEMIIDMILHKNKIPFRYECAIHLEEITLFPDFTIMHPKTGQIFYWEHFGLMDNPNYSQKAYSKLQIYTSNGIIPSIQLITTFETRDNPLNPEMVEKIIQFYFLQ